MLNLKERIIVTADDFGISPGVNRAIVHLYKDGCISRASLFPNCNYTYDAMNIVRQEVPLMPIGIHLTLTCGKCCAPLEEVWMIANEEGFLKLNFLKIIFYLINPFTKKRFLRQVEAELNAQILKLKNLGILINHIDSHRHIHTIPGIFQVVRRIAHYHQIDDIRLINESFIFTMRKVKSAKDILVGLVKFFILKSFYFINGVSSRGYFFSIIYSCKISPEILLRFFLCKNKNKQPYDTVEIMLHPGNPDMDKTYINSLPLEESGHLLSCNRIDEFIAAYELKRILNAQVS
ncbi:MAG: hypothetical protein BWY23_01017 [Spirochaetes bacterium ADurb.Bin218]|nr:MAG: hypothetical protein BWY23_01017 [Spirochaetes bacterium ADurb.Bin218]